MRRTILVAAAAFCGGVCLATATAFGSARLNVWRAYGESFQLGYVVGYLDAVRLAQRKDKRAMLPVNNVKNYDRWVREVNQYFEDPAHAKRTVPDAMEAIGKKIRAEWMQEWAARSKRARPSPNPSPSTS